VSTKFAAMLSAILLSYVHAFVFML